MTTTFANQPALGNGIFTPSEIAHFLKLPTSKVNRWMKSYWDGVFATRTGHGSSWKVNGSKAVNFLTMVEMLVMGNLTDKGARTLEVVKAHLVLSDRYKTNYPFAMKNIINQIRTDGRKVFLDDDGIIISLDGTDQTNLDFNRLLFENLDFGVEEFASRYWPLGKENCIVVDPNHKFGHPVISQTNIFPETIYGMIKAGDPPGFIASLYDFSEKEIEDAIAYCTAA